MTRKILLFAAAISACSTMPKRSATETLFGVTVEDPQRWLEDVKSPEVQRWMSEQDARTRAHLAAIPSRAGLAQRFQELFYVDSVSAPHRRGSRSFYSRTHADREKAIVYWKDGDAGEERVLLDPNGWSKDGTSSLGVWNPSWDGKKVVYGRRENARDEATLYVLDVDTGKTSDVDVIPGGKYAGPSWLPDASGFYYEFSPEDPAISVDARPGFTEIRLHKLGTDPKTDALVHPRTGDPTTFLAQSLSRDGRYLFIYVQRGWNENDIWWKDTTKGGEFALLIAGKGATYAIEAFGDGFFITTNEGAGKKRILRANPAKPARADWVELVKEDPDATLEGAGIVGGKLVATYMRNVSSEVRVFDADGSHARVVPLPGIGSVHGLVGNDDDPELFFAFSSFTQPMQVYRTTVDAGAPVLWASVKLPVDTTQFETEQVFYASKDGTKIPMFLVHRKGLAKDGTAPVLLYGYGGFDISLTPSFKASIYPWLEAGGIYAVANLRGGGEFGQAWHAAGRGALKQNVFDDFAAAAQWLLASGWTSKDHLAINGGSNGGLLMGAAMTQHPELYGAVVCAVPLLDMLRYHLFGSGRTWIPEYGSPEKEAEFRILQAYSPYHHVTPGVTYPPLLMLSADNDDRVDPMHARKFVAQVQAAGSTNAWIRIEAHAGHGGADQVKQAIQQSADMYAFLFATVGK